MVCARIWLLAALLGGVLAVAAAGGIAERVEDLQTRPGVTQRFLLLTPEEPVGSVVLFPGGHGNIALSPEGRIGWGADNFVVRTRRRFAEAGFVTVVLDVASDFKPSAGMRGYRFSAAHAEDVKAVIAHLRGLKAPVWLVGTSRGTLSAANAAARLAEGGPDGLVLTASVTREEGRSSRSLQDIALEQIRVPTLIVHHRDDQCPVTPFAHVEKLQGWLKQAPRVEVFPVSGGEAPPARRGRGAEIGDVCGPISYHGFLGREAEVVRAIADWIKAAQGTGN